MTSSKPSGIRQVPPPVGGKDKPANAYSRFIPREELADFAAWTPDAFGGGDFGFGSGRLASIDFGTRVITRLTERLAQFAGTWHTERIKNQGVV